MGRMLSGINEVGSLTRRSWLMAAALWPGLVQILTRPIALGLGAAVVFGLTLDLCLVGAYIYQAMWPAWLVALLWVLLVLEWLGGVAWAGWTVGWCNPESHREEIDHAFRQGQDLYLKGQWAQACELFERVVQLHPEDADALVQLGTTYGRLGRLMEARRTLRRCLRADVQGKWRWEVQQELVHLSTP